VSAINLSRVYDHEPCVDGKAFLVERLWPRGVRKDAIELDGWLRDVAPSRELRKWFSHDPARWEEFRRRYFAELDAHPQSWQPLVQAAASGTVTWDRDPALQLTRPRAQQRGRSARLPPVPPQVKRKDAHRPQPQRQNLTVLEDA